MRELKVNEIANVSGGSLTTLIMGFFKNVDTSFKKKQTEWIRPKGIPAANPVSGETFGRGIISIISAITFGLLFF